MPAAHAKTKRPAVARRIQAIVCGWCVLSSAALGQSPAPPPFQRQGTADGLGASQPSAVEAQYLLPLLLEEKRLLTEVGPEHPTVLALRERIRAVRDYIERHPPEPAVSLPPLRTAPTVVRTAWPTAEPPAPPKRMLEEKTSPPPPPPPPAAKVQVRPAVSLPGGGEECSMATPDERPSVIARDGAAGVLSSTESTKQPAAPEPHSLVVETVERRAEPSPPLWGTLLGQALVMGSLLLAALMIHLVGLSIILRQFSKRFALSAGAPSAALVAPSAAPGAAIESAPSSPTAERFDVGPTYQDEMRLNQERENQQQDDGLLRHIFQDNLRLHAQLEKLSPETA